MTCKVAPGCTDSGYSQLRVPFQMIVAEAWMGVVYLPPVKSTVNLSVLFCY